MPTARNGVATGVIAGQLYVVTGPLTTAVEVYDPASNTWAIKAPIPTNRAIASAGVIDGKLYVVGGCINSDCRVGVTNILQVYDPATDTWTTKASMPTARAAMATGVIAGQLYVAGGFQACYGPCPMVNTLEVYDPATNIWTSKASMPTTRSHMDGAVIDGKLYVVGGSTDGGNAIATLEVYDPSTDAWTTNAPMPTARQSHGAGEVNGILYAVSGVLAGGIAVNTVEAYDPATDTWTTVAPIPTAQYLSKPQGINGVLYVAGIGAGSSTLEAFTPDQPPVANAGPNQVVQSEGPGGTSVTLDGSGSSDPGGETLTFEWKDASNNVIGNTATLNVTAPLGTSTYTLKVTDPGGLSATATTDVSVQDTISPAIQCDSADGLWHANNVSINCTATDGGSGPALQNVALSTSVAANTEVANASTNSQPVCDAVGNCATTGPVSGNMIDRKAPSISITAPTASIYLLNQPAASGYSCSDGGSGSATCLGTVANGSNFDTATVGAKSFTVTATDNVGNSTSSAVNYSVAYAAAGMCFGSAGHAILQPVNSDGTSVFKKGSTVPAKFRACDASGNSVGSPGVVSS
ncbi:MAG: hypothetical protein HY233_09015, partial [Acidobacteriales bacterium]|nr:hypothetical protein [Terriglobales bacterium]